MNIYTVDVTRPDGVFHSETVKAERGTQAAAKVMPDGVQGDFWGNNEHNGTVTCDDGSIMGVRFLMGAVV